MSDPPVDEDALFEMVDQDPEFLRTLIDTFLRDCSSYLEAIRTAVEEERAEQLMQQAHGLKGAAANMQAEDVQAAARRLEELGRAEALDRAPPVLDTLEEEVDRLVPALEELAEEG
jgi:HPt (histidine-containing phosphotransfer) domain-containing protein